MVDFVVEGAVTLPGITVARALIDWTFQDEIDVTRSDYLISVPSARLREDEQTRWHFPDHRRPHRAKMFGLVSPGISLRCSRPQGRVRVLSCRIEKETFEARTGIDHCNPDQLISILRVDDPRFRSMFAAMADELARPGFASEEYISSLSSLMLIELARRLRNAEEAGDGGGSLTGWQLRRIQDAVVEAPGASRLTVEALAALCGLSGRHLMRGFKAATGMTLHKYIEQVRLERTKQRLREDGLPLKAIAAEMGFASASHLSAAFRKSTGLTPSAYRMGARAGLYQ